MRVDMGNMCVCSTTETPSWSTDHYVVASIWQHIEQLLSSGHGAADASIRQLTSALPCLESVDSRELPGLAQLHLNSASHLMATIRLLVPDAFKQDGELAEPDLMAICRLSGSAEGMVTTLIELQLFNLNRAKDVTGQMRQRILKRRQQQQQQQQHQDLDQMQMVTCSERSSGFCCHDDGMVQSLE